MSNLFVFSHVINNAVILFLRFVLGFIYIIHGAPKLFSKEKNHEPVGISGFAKFLKEWGVGVPLFNAWMVSILEFFGGILLVLGFLSQPVALLLAMEMLVAAYLKKFKMGAKFTGELGYEFDLILFASLLAIFVLGAGIYSVDYYLF